MMTRLLPLLLTLFSFTVFGQNTQFNQYLQLKEKYSLNQLLAKHKSSNQKANQFSLAYTYFEYDTLNNQWVPYDRNTEWIETFASQPSKINVGLKVERFQTGSWQNADSIVFIADTAINRFKIPEGLGLVDTTKFFQWNISSQKWELAFLDYLTFSGNQIQEYNSFASASLLGLPGNSSINTLKNTYQYNSSNQLESVVKYNFSFNSGSIEKSDSVLVSLDNNGFPSELTTYQIYLSTATPYDKEILVHDVYGNTTDRKYLLYNSTSSTFDTNSRTVSFYNPQRNLLSDTNYSYINKVEVKGNYGVYTYIQNYPQDYKAYSYQNGVPWLNYETDYFYTISSQVDSLIHYDLDQAGNRQFNGKEIYQYAPFTTDLKKKGKVESNHLSFYPNPTTQVIRFEKVPTTPVDIIDLTGKRIETIPSNVKEYRLSHLENGIYFLRTKFGTKKLLKY